MLKIDAIGNDLLRNILGRLPALTFASAACVNRSWNLICSSILSLPKLSSALSQNPSFEDAVEEVFNKVFSEPIRPHFAIVSCGPSFDLHRTREVFTRRLGSTIPIIYTSPFGLIGRDAITNGFKELDQWKVEENEDRDIHDHFSFEDYIDDIVGADKHNPAILFTVGFLPGLKVAAITMIQSKKEVPYLDEFVMDIRECTALVSGCTSPVAIMLFADIKTDTDHLLQKLDYALSPGTVVVGDGNGVFLAGGCYIDRKRKNQHPVTSAAALLFMQERNKPHGTGDIEFHVALSSGMSPIGPTYKASSVKDIRDKGTTWLTARREGSTENLDGQTILNQIYDEMPDRIQYPEFYIGVVKRRKCFVGLDEVRWMTFEEFHAVDGGDEEYLYVNGRGIKTGDLFRVFQADPQMALSSIQNVSEKFRSLKQDSDVSSSNILTIGPANCGKKKIFGGIVFACLGRGEPFFGKADVDSSPFLENFSGVPLAGSFCGREICRADSSAYGQTSDQGSYRCCLHAYSSVYLVMSYTPPGPRI